MVTEKKEDPQIVITKPLSLDGESDGEYYRAPNMIQKVLSLFKNVRSGSDLSRIQFQLPPIFNIPKSQLQCYGESVYCCGNDMLEKCNTKESSVERFTAVVAWSISTLRPLTFGVAPYNPVLGETHHVSSSSLNVLLEQISHHPPVTALHATDQVKNIELIWCQHAVPKFYGTSVEAEVRGTRQLKLMNFGETYTMNSPRLLIRFLPMPRVDWTGTDKIKCIETGLEAEISYGGRSFLGLGGGSRSIKGKIFDSSSMKPIFEINGHWDRTVSVKDLSSGDERVIYNAKDTITGLKTPVVKDPKNVWPSESAFVWNEVSRAILNKDWQKAKEAKNAVEERQRECLRDRKSIGEVWVPKHFMASYSNEIGWECSPIAKFVPPAPIYVP